jgi:hypothetical protein
MSHGAHIHDDSYGPMLVSSILDTYAAPQMALICAITHDSHMAHMGATCKPYWKSICTPYGLSHM